MKTTVNVYEFRDAFYKMGRKDQFSYDGLGVLFGYLESLEEDTGEEIELDVIALCCDFAEDTPESIAAAYSIEIDVDFEEDPEGYSDAVCEYLHENGAYVGTTKAGDIVYLQF